MASVDQGFDSLIQVKKDDWENVNRAFRYFYSRIGVGGTSSAAGIPSPFPRVTSFTSLASPSPNADTTDMYVLTAQAAAAAFQVPIGTPVNGQKLWIQIIDNGTARALSFSTAAGGYIAQSIAFPTTTVISTYLNIGFIYVTANSLNKWLCIARDA